MRKDEHARCADEPEERAEWRGPPEEGQANDEQSRVEGLLCHDVVTHLHRLWRCFYPKKDKGDQNDILLLCRLPPAQKQGGDTGTVGGREKEQQRLRTPFVDRGEPANEEPKRDEQQRICDSKIALSLLLLIESGRRRNKRTTRELKRGMNEEVSSRRLDGTEKCRKNSQRVNSQHSNNEPVISCKRTAINGVLDSVSKQRGGGGRERSEKS